MLRCLLALSILFYCLLLSPSAMSLGNHPESSICPLDKPYYTFCSHSLHNLEGWTGPCQSTQQLAQEDADTHSRDFHKGNSRWTGVMKFKITQ